MPGETDRIPIDVPPPSFHRQADIFFDATRTGPGLRTWVNQRVAMSGFPAAGPNAIGIVAYPQTTLGNILKGRVPWLPETNQILGHTVVKLRLDNRIVAVRGFEPNLVELFKTYNSTVAGKTSVGGYFDTSEALLHKRYAMSAELPIDREAALKHLERMRGLGQTELRWTGRPEIAEALGRPGESNCVRWALDDAMKAHPRFALELGIATADNPLPSSQGQLMARLKEMEELERLGRHTGEIRVTRSPVPWYANGVKVLGTGLVIYGGAMTIAELRDAKGKPNQREREGEALGAFVGSVVVPEVGVALCVFVGLATGGIALLPVVILLGVAGAAIGRQVGGAIGRKLDNSPIPLARNGPRYSHDDGIAPIR